MTQIKQAEIQFFEQFEEDDYKAFTDETNTRLIEMCVGLGGFQPGSLVADLGCGTGTFTELLRDCGLNTIGLDITEAVVVRALELYPENKFLTGDVEELPFDDNSLDGALLSGIVHHFPDPTRFIDEVYRVLKPGGRCVAFDPNRRNPFVWLYRDKQSPLYSPIGVTPNENPVSAEQNRQAFEEAGFTVETSFMSANYGFVKSELMKKLLPVYNTTESIVFSPEFMRGMRTLLLTVGTKKS